MCVPGIATLGMDRKIPGSQSNKVITLLWICTCSAKLISQTASLLVCLHPSFLHSFFLSLSFLPSRSFSFPLSKFLQWILLCHLLFTSNFPHRCSSVSAWGFCLRKQFLKFRLRLYFQLSSHSVISIVHTDAPNEIAGEKSQSCKRLCIACLPTDSLPEEIPICSYKMRMS